jgi:hypothetical protein
LKSSPGATGNEDKRNAYVLTQKAVHEISEKIKEQHGPT